MLEYTKASAENSQLFRKSMIEIQNSSSDCCSDLKLLLEKKCADFQEVLNDFKKESFENTLSLTKQVNELNNYKWNLKLELKLLNHKLQEIPGNNINNQEQQQ